MPINVHLSKRLYMKQKRPNDRKIAVYEPMLFGALAIAGGLIYFLVKYIF